MCIHIQNEYGIGSFSLYKPCMSSVDERLFYTNIHSFIPLIRSSDFVR
jgi:hypothetical protein